MPPPAELGLGDQPLLRISVFMSVFNVPCEPQPGGWPRSSASSIAPGKFINAELDKASEDNERNSLVIVDPERPRSAWCRSPGLWRAGSLSFVREGETLSAGERFGLIRFGSRLDIYLPEGSKALVAVGQTAIAGETVLADFKDQDDGRNLTASI